MLRRQFRRGRRPSLQQADDPCRAIEIVAQRVSSTRRISKRLIATACATQKVPARDGTNTVLLSIFGLMSSRGVSLSLRD